MANELEALESENKALKMDNEELRIPNVSHWMPMPAAPGGK